MVDSRFIGFYCVVMCRVIFLLLLSREKLTPTLLKKFVRYVLVILFYKNLFRVVWEYCCTVHFSELFF